MDEDDPVYVCLSCGHEDDPDKFGKYCPACGVELAKANPAGARPVTPKVNSKWRHHSGRVYRVMMIANIETQRPEQYPVTVVYVNVQTGSVWSRPANQWKRSFTPRKGMVMGAINWVTTLFKRWRTRLDKMQYQDGYLWASNAYREGTVPLQVIMDSDGDAPFDRGARQATMDIEARMCNQENLKGEPVGVPFLVRNV